MNIDNAKSYASVETLEKALRKLGVATHRHVVVWNSQGRCTAIFPASNIQDGDVGCYARHGFLTLG